MADEAFKDILDFSSEHASLIRYPDVADFKSIVKGAAQNEVWRDTTSETLWNILSACGKDINNIVSSSAIDYIQNLADLNTARIPALVSMATMLKYEVGSLLEIYSMFPAGLQLMLDVLSVDREYLFGGDSPILSVPLVRRLMEKMKVGLMKSLDRNYDETIALDDVFTEIKLNSHRVNDETYYALIKEIYYEMILDVLGATYSATDSTTLIDNLLHSELSSYERMDEVPRKTVLDRMIQGESRHPLDLEETVGSSITLDSSIQINPQETYSSLAEQVEALRRTYNVSHSFNPWVIADQVNEHGLSPGNELTDNEKILVETILNAHNKERFDYASGHYLLGKIDTRYGYYREKEFIKYLKAFLVLHALKVQAVNLNVTTLNLVGITVVDDVHTGVLDLFTYVNKAWEYDETETEDATVDKYGIGRAMVKKPIGITSEKHFIPRVLGSMSNLAIEANGYDCIQEYKPFGSRSIPLEDSKETDILEIIADKLTDLTFKIHSMRNEMKRQAQFNAMRGTGSLLAHAINDFLLTKYPTEQFDVIPRWSDEKSYSNKIKEIIAQDDLTALSELQAKINENIKLFRNYTNVDIIEYMDTTEYFNIHPTGIYTNDEVLLDTRYWEQLSKAITDRNKAQLGVFSPNEIREFYRNRMSMGSLHATTEVVDDIEEFLLSLYETGATDAHYDPETAEIIHPINDIANEDSLFAYESKSDRMRVQNNAELVEKQNKQFLRYSSDTSLVGNNRNRNGNGQVIEALNWKNTKYASVMLHPFMYTFQLWNPLVNIIINAMSEYITSDLERNLSNKRIFDDLYGTNGESKNFWKYNVLDFTGYVTRYEHEKHDKVDAVGEVSPLTGYDGLFYPSAIQEFIEAYERTAWEIRRYERRDANDRIRVRKVHDFTPRIPAKNSQEYGKSIFISDSTSTEASRKLAYAEMAYMGTVGDDNADAPPDGETFEQAIASIYWQLEFRTEVNTITDIDTSSKLTYYGRWFSHLGYSDERCKRIAKQLWYWRDRIVDAATHRYAVCNYNLDLGNNSMFLMDTFADELPSGETTSTPAIDALDASLSTTNNFIERSVNSNNNTTAGRCFTPTTRPKELWIRWNAEPIAMPAFDVYWNNERLQERWYDESDPTNNKTSLGAAGRFQEFGQIKYKDSITNDALNDAIENFIKVYTLDGTGATMKLGNKAPIFYSFQQNADVLVFATWRKITDSESLLGGYDRTSLCPIHILCKEVQTYDGTYCFERFLQDIPSIDPIGKGQRDSHLSAPYIFDSVGGNILIPTYRIYTPRAIDFEDDPKNAENDGVLANQSIFIKLYGLSCQSIVKSNYETREKLTIYDDKCVFINADNLFSGTVLISNGTSVLFSLDGEKLGFAFLGSLTQKSQDIVSKTLATGCTRYLADSDPQEKIALLRKRFYEVKGEPDEVAGKTVGVYADLRISDDERNIWNSFDRNDKFVCVVQYDGTLTGGNWALEAKNSSKFSARILNLVSDASYIPNFAYQSPKDFERFPEVSGINRLFKSTYFALRDHWAIQLLGLENNLLLDFVKVAQDLIVHDETNNVDTYVNPGQVVDAIYRIWEQSEMTDVNMGIERLHNPKLVFDPETGIAEWTETWVVNEEGKEAFLNRHLSLLRCNENKGGEILNEKNWVLKTIRIADFLDDVSLQNASGDGFRRASLDDFYSVALENEGRSISSTSHILVGTQDPYKYSTDPDWATTLRSPAYLLQYGNGIAGARRCEVGVFIEKRPDDEVVPGDCPSKEDAPYRVNIKVRLFKEDDSVRSRETKEISTYMDSVDVIPPKCLLMAVNEDEVDRLMDYHMLVHHEDIFYNIPNNDQDDIMRDDLVPNVEEPTHFVCPKCGYVYDESKGSSWAIPEKTSISSDVLFATFVKPTPSSIKCVWEVKDFQQEETPATLYLDYGTSQDTYEVTKKIATCTNKLAGDVTIHGLHDDTVYYARLRLTQGEGEDSMGIESAIGSFTTAKTDIPAGTKFANVPVGWKCPKCKMAKSQFKPLVDPESTGIAEDQNRSRLPANKPARNFLDYLYIYEGSTAFKINEQSDKFCTFNWERPQPELDKLLYNFRKNQVDLNCLYPWSTYVTQEHNPGTPHMSSVEMQTVNGTDCRGVEEFDQSILPIGNLMVDSDVRSDFQTFDIVIMLDTSGSMPAENNHLKNSIGALCQTMLQYNPDNRIAIVRYYQSWYYKPGDRDPQNVHYYNTDQALKQYLPENEKLYLGKKLKFTGDIDTITKVLTQTYTTWPEGATNRGTSTWQGDNTFWQSMSDENLWTTLKVITDPDLVWRKNTRRMMIYISDEAVDNYVPVVGKTWIATIDGQRLNYEGAYDEANFKNSRIVWTSTNRIQGEPDDPVRPVPNDTTHPNTVRQQFNWGQNANGNAWTMYHADHINAKIFQETLNDFGIQFHYVETETKDIGPDKDIRSMSQRIDWVDTYVYRVQKDLMDGLSYGGYTYSIEPQNLAETLEYIFNGGLTPGVKAIWEYDVQPTDSTADIIKKMVDAGYSVHAWEDESGEDNGGGTVKTIDVSGSDFDSMYKIYANYQKIEDPLDPRGYHFDLFFNIQNLFKPPFEYISDVTHQPAPHLLPNSYLYLPGDKNSKLESKGGKLTLYAQMKWLINDLTASVKTIPLITYEIYNISDDKPKFFLKRIGEMENVRPTLPTVFIKFEDVYLDGSELLNDDGTSKEEFDVIQTMSVHYNNDVSSEYNQLNKLKFNIVANTVMPVLGSTTIAEPPYINVDKTKKFCRPSSDNPEIEIYPLRFNDYYSVLGRENYGYSVCYRYPDEGYTNEDMYLYWTIPKGVNVAEAIQKLGCLVEDDAVKCTALMRSGDDARVVTIPGHIYITSLAGSKKYLGVEHGKTLNKFGYVLTTVSNVMKKVLLRDTAAQ